MVLLCVALGTALLHYVFGVETSLGFVGCALIAVLVESFKK